MATENRGGGLERVIRGHTTIGPHIKYELLVVGALTHARVLHEEVHTRDRGEDRIDCDATDLLIGGLVALGQAEATADADFTLHIKHGALFKRRDFLTGVEHLDGVLDGEIAGDNRAGAFLLQVEFSVLARERLEQHALQVEDDVRHVLRDARHRRELMADALDLDRADRAALDGREEHAAERIPDCAGIADFKRLCLEAGIRSGRRGLVLLDALRHFKTTQTDRH